MRKIILTLVSLLFTIILFGQNENPYSQFGYEAPIMEEIHDFSKNTIDFLITNDDTTSLLAYLSIDTKNHLIRFYSDESQILLEDTIINYKMARWISPDPAYQHNSPYLGMSNNPITRVDPDGALDLGPFGYFNNFNDYYIHFAGLNFRNLGTGGGSQFWCEWMDVGITEKVVRNVKYNHLQNVYLIPGRTFYTSIIRDNGKLFEKTSFQTTLHLFGSGASKYKNFSHIQGVQFSFSNGVTVSNNRGKEIFTSSSEERNTGMLRNSNYYFSTSRTLNPINREVALDPNTNTYDEINVYGAAGKRFSAVHRIKATPKFFEELEKAGVATVE